MKKTFEITTNVGCHVNCDFCPQKEIVRNYHGARMLSMTRHAKCIESIPEDVVLRYCGVSEPFLCPWAVDLMLYSHAIGRKVDVVSTLVGLTMEGAELLADIPFGLFDIHEPDSEDHAKIPLTQEYMEVKEYIKRHVRNVTTMNMGGTFQSNLSEVTIREMFDPEQMKYTVNGPRHLGCERLDNPTFMMMPNGKVNFCCTTRGICGEIGDLEYDTYAGLAARLPEIAREMKRDHDSLCHHCTMAKPLWKHEVIRVKERIFGERRLLQ